MLPEDIKRIRERHSRQEWKHWGDKESLMPVQHPGGVSLANGRYWVSLHEVDPEPITAEQWEKRIDGTAVGSVAQ